MNLPQLCLQRVMILLFLVIDCSSPAIASRKPKECYRLQKNGTSYVRKTVKCNSNQNICILKVNGKLLIGEGCGNGKPSECDLNKENSKCACVDTLCETGTKYVDVEGLDMDPNLIFWLTIFSILGVFLICAVIGTLIGLVLGLRHKHGYRLKEPEETDPVPTSVTDPTMENLFTPTDYGPGVANF